MYNISLSRNKKRKKGKQRKERKQQQQKKINKYEFHQNVVVYYLLIQ